MSLYSFAAQYSVKPNGRTSFPLIFLQHLNVGCNQYFCLTYSLSLVAIDFAPHLSLKFLLLHLGTDKLNMPIFFLKTLISFF